MPESCGDNRFVIIERAKQAMLKSTNIASSPEEMAVLDNILFRCWQLGWLYRFEDEIAQVANYVGLPTKSIHRISDSGGGPRRYVAISPETNSIAYDVSVVDSPNGIEITAKVTTKTP